MKEIYSTSLESDSPFYFYIKYDEKTKVYIFEWNIYGGSYTIKKDSIDGFSTVEEVSLRNDGRVVETYLLYIYAKTTIRIILHELVFKDYNERNLAHTKGSEYREEVDATQKEINIIHDFINKEFFGIESYKPNS